jgi:MFS superfamily sulfate permease-like transporter
VPGYHDLQHYPDAEQVPGLLIVRWSAPLFFANANLFRDRIRSLVKEASPAPLWVLVAAEPITDIDTTAGTMLADLDLELNSSGIHLAFAELQTSVRDAIRRYGLLDTIDQGHLYPSVTEAVKAFRREVGGGEGAPASSEAPPVSGA